MDTILFLEVAKIEIEDLSRIVWICSNQISFGELKIVVRLNMIFVELLCFFLVVAKRIGK